MKQKGTYAVCLLILVCLIGSAFYAPDLVMQWNDYQLLQDYQFRKRNGIDYETINTNYIADRQERLNTFAKGIGEGMLLNEAGILWLGEGIYDSSSITVCDHYVIYDNEGVNFLCWYLEIRIEEEIIRMLIDTEDHTIYYLECYHQGVFQLFTDHYTKGVMDWSWFTSDLMNVKQLYGDISVDVGKVNSSKISEKKYKDVKTDGTSLEERHEVNSNLQYEDGSLRLQTCVLNRVNELYGFGIGIKELWDLLPMERKGECLVSFG